LAEKRKDRMQNQTQPGCAAAILSPFHAGQTFMIEHDYFFWPVCCQESLRSAPCFFSITFRGRRHKPAAP